MGREHRRLDRKETTPPGQVGGQSLPKAFGQAAPQSMGSPGFARPAVGSHLASAVSDTASDIDIVLGASSGCYFIGQLVRPG